MMVVLWYGQMQQPGMSGILGMHPHPRPVTCLASAAAGGGGRGGGGRESFCSSYSHVKSRRVGLLMARL